MAKVEVDLDEMIATLNDSNLPAIIVEGKDDIIIYRKLEEEISNVVVTPVGGRANVLKIFQETINPNGRLYNKNIVFIADQDIWINIGIPDEFKNQKLIFTSGYSIENDIFIDYCCQKMIDDNPDIKSNFNQDKEKFIYWYALALQNTLNADGFENREISTSVHHLFNQYNEFSRLQENENYPTELKEDLEENYALKVRGKSLLELFSKTFKEHKPRAMFEAIAVRPDNCINRIFDDVKRLF